MINWIITLRGERDSLLPWQGVIAHKGRLIFNTDFYMLGWYSTRGRPTDVSTELQASLPQGETHADMRRYVLLCRFLFFYLVKLHFSCTLSFQKKCFSLLLINKRHYFVYYTVIKTEIVPLQRDLRKQA